MKLFTVLFLILIIQITFIQKVSASTRLLESQNQSMIDCKMDKTHKHCFMDVALTINCQDDCDMAGAVSILHFIEDVLVVSFTCSNINYPTLIISPKLKQPNSLYRPPLFS